MFKYNCLNPIAAVGLDLFSDQYDKVDELKDAQAALVRSAAMHDLELPDTLEAVARAGAAGKSAGSSESRCRSQQYPAGQMRRKRYRRIQYTGCKCKRCQRARVCRYALCIP